MNRMNRYLTKKMRKICSKKEWKRGKCGCSTFIELSKSPNFGATCIKDIKLY